MDDQNTAMPPAQTNTSPTNTDDSQDPGRTMAIVGIVFAVIFALVGLILCLIAKNKSQKAGFDNKLATIGIWIAAANMLLSLVYRLSTI